MKRPVLILRWIAGIIIGFLLFNVAAWLFLNVTAYTFERLNYWFAVLLQIFVLGLLWSLISVGMSACMIIASEKGKSAATVLGCLVIFQCTYNLFSANSTLIPHWLYILFEISGILIGAKVVIDTIPNKKA